MEFSFDQFTKKIYIKAPKNELYAKWSTSDGITQWFLSNATYTSPEGSIRGQYEEIKPGDRYTWEWHNWNGKEQGTILQANGNDFLEFTFGSNTCKVAITFETDKESTLLILRQYEMATDEKTKMNLYNG